MMIQIGHRESHDIDIFIDDPQILGFLDPSKADLKFREMPAEYDGDGARFQKFAFADVGEIDFIVSGTLTAEPFITKEIQGRKVKLESIPEIIAKKVYHRGSEAKPRDIFDMAAASRGCREQLITALRAFPGHVSSTLTRIDALNPEFVTRTIGQLMVLPDYKDLVPQSLDITRSLLKDVLAP